VHSDFKIDYEKYHTYTIEWTPDYMSYKIDDIEIRRLDNELISGLQEE
jgi:beta-glucanase (GH16 family)